jgi:hypothetical protein
MNKAQRFNSVPFKRLIIGALLLAPPVHSARTQPRASYRPRDDSIENANTGSTKLSTATPISKSWETMREHRANSFVLLGTGRRPFNGVERDYRGLSQSRCFQTSGLTPDVIAQSSPLPGE